ncbi:MAG TPA: hypothetical protein VFC07_13790, partial [Verrucomicrobiae bacterium]|nr:hypothetical protein [Verrucomicrobiae bacterium]
MQNITRIVGIGALVVGTIPTAFNSDGQTLSLTTETTSSIAASANQRYGLFNSLDRRSAYGVGVFPEPFLVDDSDLEPNEFRLDWLHTKATNQHADSAKAEVEKGFGLL